MEENQLKNCQQIELEILKDFRQICESLDLKYYLTAGTLLGAIRHKGFIPWDDDIDVAMPREDYDKFASIGAKKLGDDYFYQSYITESNFPYYFAKIRKTGTRIEEPILRSIRMNQGVYIDIFPLDQCPDNDKAARMFFRIIELLDSIVLGKVASEFVCGYQKWYVKSLWKFLQIFSNQQIFCIRECVRKTAAKLSTGKRLCTVGGHHGFPKETYQGEWFSGVTKAEFEGELFQIPQGWENLLKNMYGEYMTLPSEKERQGHFDTK